MDLDCTPSTIYDSLGDTTATSTHSDQTVPRSAMTTLGAPVYVRLVPCSTATQTQAPQAPAHATPMTRPPFHKQSQTQTQSQLKCSKIVK